MYMTEGSIESKEGAVVVKTPKNFLKPKTTRLIIFSLISLDAYNDKAAAKEAMFTMTKVTQALVNQL
jgi:hypothetical protein